MPWLKIGAGVVLMALGAAICVWTYANPRIDSLEAQIAQIKAADMKASNDFLMAVQVKQAQIQAKADKAEADYAALQATTNKRIAVISADNVGLRKSIAAYASSSAFKLPATGQAIPGIDGRSETLGLLLSDCLDLSAARAADAEQLANQVRGLQTLVQ